MADTDHILLNRPTRYNIEDSNIALLGSDLEKHVREQAGDKEAAWDTAGKEVATQIWRVEKFTVVEWPKERFGSFYDGDSYIVLHTYKKTPDAEELSYDLHFWIGSESTQDEAGTAAYKTVELDDREFITLLDIALCEFATTVAQPADLNGQPVQYREIQGFESPKFLSYFSHFLCLRGGVATGFHHVSTPPPDDTRRLYRIISTGTRLLVREVHVEGASLVPGDAYVLDMGTKIWQLNTKGSVGKEKFKAAEFAQSLVNERGSTSPCDVTVFDEGGHGVGTFLAEVGLEAMPSTAERDIKRSGKPQTLLRLSDSTGKVTFDSVEPTARSTLSSSDAFLLDDTSNVIAPAIYVWIGNEASLTERRLALQYAQAYLYEHQEGGHAAASIVKMKEGHETEVFLHALGG
ncbi:hypothetical protein EW026_g3690 [Hermanssonia centrifuga]|uniref:Gelsolin-like domain-containing protein n=1 Tax=Hermanssonia centrifuga TaxID=98765 RepID=A0A4S4KKF3_9APHY|nr:hypothetical protein EW026_g3690 [Hermanssonia centrifuga]